MAAAESIKLGTDEAHLSSDDLARITQLPKSAREIYIVLQQNGALKPQQIGTHTSLSNRTIRYALKILVDAAFIKRVPDLRDLRTHFYTVN